MTLTLPIVVGKKYVRRDGKTTQARTSSDGYDRVDCVCIATGDEDLNDSDLHVYKGSGRVSFRNAEAFHHPFDLVADYIEPAKGHPHAAAMAEFAKDAAESVTPWDRWEKLGPYEGNQWEPMGCDESFFPFNQYRRKPTITPDPHAATAAEYAKDMAETDKAWERWEYSPKNHSDVWSACFDHPAWRHATMYRRRSQS